ncbi:MAG: class I SAM-dependent methyltransferase [Chloroflexota bacterium]
MSTQSFDAVAEKYDRWYKSPEGRYIDTRENELFLRLVKPRAGESLIEVGCGTGHNLVFFQKLGFKVSGVEPCQPMLQVAAKQCAPDANLCCGEAGHLEFPDGSFDIAVIITALEFMADPVSALKETFRVSRSRVYLGVLNQLSFIGLSRRVKACFFRKSIYCQAHFYTIWELKRLIKKIIPEAEISWGSVLLFPFGWHRFFKWLDECFSLRQNPFGAFLGICVTKAKPK